MAAAIGVTGRASDEIDAQLQVAPQGQQHEIAEAAVPHEDVVGCQQAEHLVEHRPFRGAQITTGQAQDRAAEQGEEHPHAHHGEIGLGRLHGSIAFAVFGGVGRREGGTIGNFDRSALEQRHGGRQLVSGLGGGTEGFGELAQGQAGFGAAVSAVLFGDVGPPAQVEEGLDFQGHLAAGGLGIEGLPEHGPEGAGSGVDAVAAVGFLGGLGEERLGHVRREALFEMSSVNKKTQPLARLQRQYEQLSRPLGEIGLISQGSVQDRRTRQGGGAGYQWTRKLDQKTVTVSLTAEQFDKMKEAVGNYRRLRGQLRELEKLSRRIIFQSTPHPRRRKRLSQKVLGTK